MALHCVRSTIIALLTSFVNNFGVSPLKLLLLRIVLLLLGGFARPDLLKFGLVCLSHSVGLNPATCKSLFGLTFISRKSVLILLN